MTPATAQALDLLINGAFLLTWCYLFRVAWVRWE
jgi:hypothetical protein